VNRFYRWTRDDAISPIIETAPLYYTSGTDYGFHETANVTKQVLGVQTTRGKPLFISGILVGEYYFGVSIRYKYRTKQISFHEEGGSPPKYYSPPKKEVDKNGSIGVQAALPIGLALRTSKKSYKELRQRHPGWKEITIIFKQKDVIGLTKVGEIEEVYVSTKFGSYKKALKVVRKKAVLLWCRRGFLTDNQAAYYSSSGTLGSLKGIAYVRQEQLVRKQNISLEPSFS